jgi:hypothetical protein
VAPSRHRFGSLIRLCATGVAFFALAAPATAETTGLDRDDQPAGAPFDLRWVGAYRQDADTVRVGISFWDPVRRSDFNEGGIWLSMNPSPPDCPACTFDADGAILPREGGGWVARLYDDGYANPIIRATVRHPDPHLFQVLLPAIVAGDDISVSVRGDGGITITAP